MSYGCITEFLPDEESITSYLERVDLYFAANAVAQEKKVAVFLSIIGRDTSRHTVVCRAAQEAGAPHP